MISSWRRIKERAVHRGRDKRSKREDVREEETEATVPSHFRCPISLDLMKDPVTMSSGITYDRGSIEAWMEAGNRTCPVTNTVLRSIEPIPNHALRKMIQDWCVENSARGIERIPTPRVPVGQSKVREILARIASAGEGRDRVCCGELVAKVRALIRESERNKRCVKSSGTCAVLAKAFEEFSNSSNLEENSLVAEEILSTITMMLPLDGEAQSSLGLTNSLRAMVWYMLNGSLSTRRNSALTIREVVSGNKPKIEALSGIEGATDALFRLINEPICPAATKSSLVVIYYMVTLDHPSRDRVISEYAAMGLVSLLLEMLVDADRSVCEKALGVLDGMCDGQEGRKAMLAEPLALPVLVKKLLRVSGLATEFVVSVIWKLGKQGEEEGEGEGGGSFWVELLQFGAFQKLLLLLQIGCGERTKEKATGLMKSLNARRDSLECVDSQDFKCLKRPY